MRRVLSSMRVMEASSGSPISASWLLPLALNSGANVTSTLFHPVTGDPFLHLLDLNGSLQNESFLNSTKTVHMASQGPSVAGVLIPLIYIVVCIIGLGGNTLVIHIVLHYSKTESVTNIYILNLAIADELFMLGLPFLAVQNALSSWPFGSFMCRLVMTVDGINQFTSIFCLTVMSIDRYLAVVHPIRSCKWRKPQVAKAVNGTVWAVSFIVVLPVVIFSDVPKGGGICNIDWPQPADIWRAAFIIYTSTLGFFGPLLIICLCYLLIVVKVRSAGKKVQATSTRRKKSERKVTRMVVIVVAVFVFCWLPFYALNIINLVVSLPKEPMGVYFFVVVLSYANSCANPIVYGFLSDNFKRGFRKALCRSTRKVESQEQLAVAERHRRRQEEEDEVEEHKQRVPEPRDSLHRRCRDEDDDEDDEDREVTEMTEICHIAQNGDGRGRPETSRALFLQKGVGEGLLGTSPVSPGHQDPKRAVEPNGKGPIFAAPAPALVNGAKNGSVKPMPEEPSEKNALLEISYL